MELRALGRFRAARSSGLPDDGPAVVFDTAHCPGCDGRCGVRLGATPPLAVAVELPDGAPVEVVAGAGFLAWRALGVFGVPLLATVVAAVFMDAAAWGDWPLLVGLFGGVLVALGLRFFRTPGRLQGRLFGGAWAGLGDRDESPGKSGLDVQVAVESRAAGPARIRLF